MNEDELKRAMRNAHNAGDVRSAMRISAMLDRSQASAGDKAESIAKSAGMGIADPFLGASQLIYRGGAAAAGLAERIGVPGAEWAREGLEDGVSDVDAAIQRGNRGVQAARDEAGFEGVDLSRIGGNIVSPINAIPALGAATKIKAGATLGNVAMQGAKTSAIASAMMPVADTENYAREKLGQVALGTATGAALTPAISAVSTWIGRVGSGLGKALTKQNPDDVIMAAFKDAGLDAADYSAAQMSQIRGQVGKALKRGKLLDPASLARKADFDDLGVPYTSGMVTRDPKQFAMERNYRNLDDIGEPLMARMNEADRAIAAQIGDRARGAKSIVDAGDDFIDDLTGLDRRMGAEVSSKYKQARASANAADEVPMTGLAQDMANISRNYEGAFPKGLQNQFDDYGLAAGRQTKTFGMEDAESLLRQTNRYGNATDDAVKNSIDETRAALKRAITEGADDGGPFAVPRQAAAERFRLQESTKALDDVVTGRAVPDKFVDKYIIKAPTKDVENLGKILSPKSRDEARKQIAAFLDDKAYGVSNNRDAGFGHKPYNRALNDIGDRRLAAFFDADEIAKLKRIGRVAENIVSQPKNAAVNNSNTASALYNTARATGSGLFNQPLLDFVPKVADRYAKARGVDYALTNELRAQIPLLANKTREKIGLFAGFGGLTGGLLSPMSRERPRD